MSELAEIKRILQRLLNKFELIYPETNDLDATYADTKTVPASSILTLTLTFGAEWRIILSELYVDIAAGITAAWYYKGKKVNGNKVEFTKHQLFSHPENIVLKITNTTLSSADLDVHVKAFGRMLGGE